MTEIQGTFSLDDEGNLTEHNINMIFTVTEMDGRRIKKVNLKIKYLTEEEKDSDKEN